MSSGLGAWRKWEERVSYFGMAQELKVQGNHQHDYPSKKALFSYKKKFSYMDACFVLAGGLTPWNTIVLCQEEETIINIGMG